jgi:hypothetical protein
MSTCIILYNGKKKEKKTLNEAIEEEPFFLQKSNISNTETHSNIMGKMCEAKGGETTLLHVIEKYSKKN